MVKNDGGVKPDFFSGLMIHQIEAREFFCEDLLQALCKHLGYRVAVIFYFDTDGNFLSWRDLHDLHLAGPDNAYSAFKPSDIVRHAIHRDAMRDHLTYYDTEPRIYKSTDVCNCVYYGNSAYAHFVEETFGGYYSATLAFGNNAYIQVSFFKSLEEGDFTLDEMSELEQMYGYIANSYKTFKKYEQARIVSSLQSDIMESGERAFFVIDNTLHVMGFNKVAKEYLTDLLGDAMASQMGKGEQPCSWLSIILNGAVEDPDTGVETSIIKDYTFRIHQYDRSYSNGIVDRYSWITISRAGEEPAAARQDLRPAARPIEGEKDGLGVLTPAERRVAELMYQGLTYQEIADELVISFHTVKKHVQNIYSKCRVNSRFQLLRWMEEQQK